MKIINWTKTVILLVFLTSFKSDKLPKTFTDLLTRANMQFDATTNFNETKIIENRQMNYEYATKHTSKKFEIRYSIRPLDLQLKDFAEKEKNKKKGDININPNNLYNSFFQATILNISGGQLPEFNEFDKDAVKNKFNADWGATTFVTLGKDFGQEYKYCMVLALHKDNFADAYVFYLSNVKEGFDELMNPAFHSLKFK
jgi:hypothetical protein